MGFFTSRALAPEAPTHRIHTDGTRWKSGRPGSSSGINPNRTFPDFSACIGEGNAGIDGGLCLTRNAIWHNNGRIFKDPPFVSTSHGISSPCLKWSAAANPESCRYGTKKNVKRWLQAVWRHIRTAVRLLAIRTFARHCCVRNRCRLAMNKMKAKKLLTETDCCAIR